MKNSRNNSHRNSTKKLGPHNRNAVELSKIWITSISPHAGKTERQSNIAASEAPQRPGLTLMLILTVGFLKVNKWQLIPFASERLTKGEKRGRQAIAWTWTAQTHSKGKLCMQRKNQRQLKMDDYPKNSDSEKTVAVNNKTKFIWASRSHIRSQKSFLASNWLLCNCFHSTPKPKSAFKSSVKRQTTKFCN